MYSQTLKAHDKLEGTPFIDSAVIECLPCGRQKLQGAESIVANKMDAVPASTTVNMSMNEKTRLLWMMTSALTGVNREM